MSSGLRIWVRCQASAPPPPPRTDAPVPRSGAKDPCDKNPVSRTLCYGTLLWEMSRNTLPLRRPYVEDPVLWDRVMVPCYGTVLCLIAMLGKVNQISVFKVFLELNQDD